MSKSEYIKGSYVPALMFKAMDNPLRRSILDLLAEEYPKGLNQTVIAQRVNSPPQTVSPHIRVLRASGLVEYKHQGSGLVHRIDEDGIKCFIDACKTWMV